MSDTAGNAGTIIQIVSAALAIISVTGGISTAWFSRKDSKERKSERERVESERRRTEADRDKISAEAAEVALRSLRNELDAAYNDIERRRKVMVDQDQRIDQQDRIIRTQNRRIDALEEWITETKAKLEAAGINGLPPVPMAAHIEAEIVTELPAGGEAEDRRGTRS